MAVIGSLQFFTSILKGCRTIRQKSFRQIAENRFGKVAELSPMKLPIRQKSIRQLCKCKLAANSQILWNTLIKE
jgi:hypothetical protein